MTVLTVMPLTLMRMPKRLWGHLKTLFGSCFAGTTPGITNAVSEEKSPSSGIKFKVAPHGANAVTFTGSTLLKDRREILLAVWNPSDSDDNYNADEYTICKEIFQSSLGTDASSTSSFLSKKNGFVDTVLQAYNRHHELIIRPDDVWIAILSQLNIYVNANAEDLRSFFVAHEGQKKLKLVYEGVTRYTMDFSIMARDFASLLKKNINDPTLYDVILPSFSTTTENDETICSAMMMSIMKAYFSYVCCLCCGIPAITLMGTRKDYESILTRLNKIEEMGKEAQMFVALLRPIIHQFIATFDAVAAGRKPNMDFWGKVCHEHYGGSGPDTLSGWLTAFCVWDSHGKWQGPRTMPQSDLLEHPADEKSGETVFDASIYGQVNMDNIPVGFSEVPVKLEDNGKEFSCVMVAGHVGARVSGPGVIGDTLQPEPHWFMFEVEKVKRT